MRSRTHCREGARDQPVLASIDTAGLLTLHAECVSFVVRADYTTVDGTKLSAEQPVSVTSDMVPTDGCRASTASTTDACREGSPSDGVSPTRTPPMFPYDRGMERISFERSPVDETRHLRWWERARSNAAGRPVG